MRWAGRSPLTLDQEISGVGLDSEGERDSEREETKSDDDTRAGGLLRLSGSNGGFFHLQSFGNALHLQHLSSQHYLGAGGARWDEEGWLPLIRWVFYSYTHRFTEKTITLSSA